MSRPYKEGQKQLMRRSGHYPVGDIAQAAGISKSHVYAMLREGRLRGTGEGSSRFVELDSAIEAWSGLPPVVEALRALREEPGE